ncbi:N-acetyltransferase [Rhodoferax sediminis]|uniref:N-acetyltransferase n=1 Tax=Rhodoferax sediminis TaxID=2509614 RepID=A0A515D856_9BURK|nr:N-acetyltransferase [Rhodoferax sediminis]QDL36589.1 N-acetyltransferase [Rhodoferax sediminis]
MRRINGKCGLYCYRLVVQPLADHPRLPPSRGKKFAFHLLTEFDPILDSLDRPSAVIRQRFVQGAQCLVATRDESLVGCIWFVRGPYAEDEVRVDFLLPQGGRYVWDFDVFVAESERLGFLFAKQWDAFDALLKPLGVSHTVSRINAFNQRSKASHRSLGAIDCGWALFVGVGPFQWMLSSQRPFAALGGRPALHIKLEVTSES